MRIEYLAMLKRLFCRHWFDVKDYEYEYYEGPIVGVEVKTWRTKAQKRTCSKCGAWETRNIGKPIYLGWQ